MNDQAETDSARLRRASERYDKVVGSPCKFERGVKLITKEKRFDRAMPWFRRFLRSRSDSEKVMEAALETCRAEGFTPLQVPALRRDFNEWKAKEKSQTARINRAKRKKKIQ